MSPSEMEEYLLEYPLVPFRLILASGDHVIVREADEPFVVGMSLVLRGKPMEKRIMFDSRLISIPNIVLLEPLPPLPPSGRMGRSRR